MPLPPTQPVFLMPQAQNIFQNVLWVCPVSPISRMGKTKARMLAFLISCLHLTTDCGLACRAAPL